MWINPDQFLSPHVWIACSCKHLVRLFPLGTSIDKDIIKQVVLLKRLTSASFNLLQDKNG